MFGRGENLVSVGNIMYPGYIGQESFDAIKPGVQPWIATAGQIAREDQPESVALLGRYGRQGGRFGNLHQEAVQTPIGEISPYHDNVFNHTLRAMLLTYAAQFDTQGNLVVTPAEVQFVANQIILPHDIMEAVMVANLQLGTDISRVDGASKATRMADILTLLKPLGLGAKNLEFALAGESLSADLVHQFLLFQRATDFANRRSGPESLARTDLEIIGRLSPDQAKLLAEQLRTGDFDDEGTSVERLIARHHQNPNKPSTKDYLQAYWSYLLESAEGNMTYMNNVVALMTAPWFDAQKHAAYIPGDRSLSYPLGDIYAGYYGLQRLAEAHKGVVTSSIFKAAHYTLAAQRIVLARLAKQGMNIPAFVTKWANVPLPLQALLTTPSIPVFAKTKEPIAPRALVEAPVTMKKPVVPVS